MIQLLQLRWSSCFSSGDPAASVDPGDPMRDAVDLFYLAVYVDTSLSCWSSLDHVDTADSLLLQFRRSSCFRYFRSGDPAASDISDQVIQRLQIFQIRWSSCFRCFSSGDPSPSDISDQVIQLLQIFQIMWSSCFKYFRSGDPAASDISDQVIQLLHIFQIRWSRGFRYFRSGDPAASVDPVDPVSLVNFLSWPPPPLWHFYHLQITILLKSFNQVRSCKYCSGALCNKGWLNLLRKN